MRCSVFRLIQTQKYQDREARAAFTLAAWLLASQVLLWRSTYSVPHVRRRRPSALRWVPV
jgi:hypothetical protein